MKGRKSSPGRNPRLPITGPQASFVKQRPLSFSLPRLTRPFLAVLDKRYADVLMLNLSNQVIFTCADHDSAVIASKSIGEREVVEKTWGYPQAGGRLHTKGKSNRSSNRTDCGSCLKFNAIVCHCERSFCKRLIPPIMPDGTFQSWFTRQRPEYAALQWMRSKFQRESQS